MTFETIHHPSKGPFSSLEVMLSAQDYDAELAERYGWSITRA